MAGCSNCKYWWPGDECKKSGRGKDCEGKCEDYE